MSLFAWANKQLETLSDKLAPVPNDTSYRFYKACSSNDTNLALQLISPTPPPMPDGTFASPIDPFHTVISSKGTLPLHCAAVYAQTAVVQALINQHGVPAEQFDPKGNTPLHYAALSASPTALSLVKMLVSEYNVSVTVKNADGRTPYDVATQDSVRQYLLPIQLQKETQECLDNGGIGLPQGIDMGGLKVNRANLAPPPIVGGFGSPTPGGGPPPMGMGSGGVNSYSAAGMSASKYAVPTFGNDPSSSSASSYAQPAPDVATNYGQGHQGYGMQPHPIQGHVNTNMSQPVTPMGNHAPFSPTAATAAPVVPIAAGNVATTNVPPAAAVSSPAAALANPVTTQPAPANSTPEVAVATTTPSAATEGIASNAGPVSADVSPTNAAPSFVPTVPAENAAPSPTATSAVVDSTPAAVAPVTTPITNAMPPNPNPMVARSVSAPTSGSSYARRGHSSAAVLPSKSKYIPDGFHSSSSDVSLQKKYGHDASITGPPSGQFSRTNIAPPPKSAGAPPAASSVTAGYNPYASGGGLNSYARPRYPTYDAVSGTVGAAPGQYQNPYAAQQQPATTTPQYNVYAPTNHQYQNQYPNGDQYLQQQPQQQNYGYGYQQQQQQQQQGTYDYNQQYQQHQTYNYNQQYQQQQQAYQQHQTAHVADTASPVQTTNSAGTESAPASTPTNHAPAAVHSPQQQTDAAMANSPPVATMNINQQNDAVSINVNTTTNTPVATQSSQEFFSGGAAAVTTPQSTADPPIHGSIQALSSPPIMDVGTATATISEQIQNLSVSPVETSQPQRQTSASELFGSSPSTTSPAAAAVTMPVVTEDNRNAGMVVNNATSAADLFGSTAAPAEAVVVQQPTPTIAFPGGTTNEPAGVGAGDDTGDDLLPPPPFVSEETTATVTPELSSLGATAEATSAAEAAVDDDDFLPPPPFGVEASDENIDVGDADDDLPPPPMMDVAL